MPNHDQVDSLLLSGEVAARIHCNPVTLYKWVKVGKFPPPMKRNRLNVWKKSDVEAWLSQLPTATSLVRPVPVNVKVKPMRDAVRPVETATPVLP